MPPPMPLRINAVKQLFPRGTAKATAAKPSLPTTTITLFKDQLQCSPHSIRSFSSTPTTSRNAKASSTKWEVRGVQKTSSKAKAPEAATTTEEPRDPFDFSALEASINKSIERLGNDLGKLRTGGRFNPEVLENVRVVVEKGGKESIRLGELAQVLPKGGRSVMVLVGEKDHVKPIISAIQGSKDLNLQPQQDPLNQSQLNIAIPPPTKESRDLALAAAMKAGEAAKIGVQSARAAMQKKLRVMEVKKTVRPDDLKKAHKEMEKVVEKGVMDVKKTVEAARKHMEQS